MPREGKFFLLYLVCFNLKGERRHLHPRPAGVRPQHGSAPTRLWSVPTPEVLSSVPPSPSGEGWWLDIMGGPPANLVRVGGKIPTDFAGGAAGMKGDRVPCRRLSLLKSDLRGRGVSGGSSTGSPSALRSPPSAGRSEVSGNFCERERNRRCCFKPFQTRGTDERGI